MPHREQSPNALPPELAAFLQDKPYARLTHATDQGTVVVVKAPGHEIESLRGSLPVHVRHLLYQHPAAPVIRMVITLYDEPHQPIAFETFLNVADPQ